MVRPVNRLRRTPESEREREFGGAIWLRINFHARVFRRLTHPHVALCAVTYLEALGGIWATSLVTETRFREKL